MLLLIAVYTLITLLPPALSETNLTSLANVTAPLDYSTLVPNVPLNTHLNKGDTALFECVIPKSAFESFEKINVQVLVSSLLNVRLFRRSCGMPCKKYLTNDRLHSMTDKMILYKEEEHQDLHLVAEVKAFQNVQYRLSFQVFYDQQPPVIPLEIDEMSHKGRLTDSP